MRFKKLLAMSVLSIAFLSAGTVAFAESVAVPENIVYSQEQSEEEKSQLSVPEVQVIAFEPEQELSDSQPEPEQSCEDVSPEQEQEISDTSPEKEQSCEIVSSVQDQIKTDTLPETERSAIDIPKESEVISGEISQLSYQSEEQEKPAIDTGEKALAILRQPEDQRFVPGFSITLSFKAEGNDLSYQWYYKKLGQTGFSVWKGRTHAIESVAPGESWDGIELYCEVTDGTGNSLRTNTVMVCMDDTIKILAVGDSICRGARNGYRGFVGDLGLPFVNLALNSATLAANANDITDIPTQLANTSGYEPDILIADGSVNDYLFNAPMGNIPTEPLSGEDEIDDKAAETVMGGLQRLFLLMTAKYPEAKRYFVITHKTTQRIPMIINEQKIYTDNDSYVNWCVTKNKEGYTQQELHDALVACCNVYGVEVIDVYNDGFIDTSLPMYCSKVSYLDDQSITDTEYVDIDGVHPLSLGYSECYLPMVKSYIHNVQQPKELVMLKQPENQTVDLGQPLTLSLKASGDFLKYQWYYKKEGQSEFKEWTNRVRPTEIVTPPESWDGIQLYCLVTDKYGHSIQSEIITVTVEQKLAIIQQPKSCSVIFGQSLTLTVKAEGIGLKYQWYYKKKEQNEFSQWRNRVRPTETVTPPESWDGIQLYCLVTDKNGHSIQSEIITVSQQIAMIEQSKSCSVTVGEPLTLSVKAQGIDLQYQWYFKKKGQSEFSQWRNRVRPTETVTPPESWDGIQLYCLVTDKYGHSIQSEFITVIVEQKLAIIQQPKSCSVIFGQSLTLTVKAEGIGLKYQWYYKKKEQNEFSQWRNRVRPTETVTPPESWDGIQLFCKVTDQNGRSVESDIITVKFNKAS